MSLYRFKPFVETFKDRGITPGSLRHQIVHAGANGLEAAGAVHRFYPRGAGVGKPIITIDAEKYFMVLGGQGSR